MPPRRPSRLTPDILADDVLVGETIDQILLDDEPLQRIPQQVVRRQRALRAAITEEQWRLYMLFEEAFNEYHSRAVVVVARAFYAAGKRSR